MMSFRKYSPLATGALLLLILFSCRNNQVSASANFEPMAVEISIKGMTCTGCEQTISTSLTKLEGVQSVNATFTDGRAVVVYLPGKTDTASMRQAISGKGYSVNKFTVVQPSEIVN